MNIKIIIDGIQYPFSSGLALLKTKAEGDYEKSELKDALIKKNWDESQFLPISLYQMIYQSEITDNYELICRLLDETGFKYTYDQYSKKFNLEIFKR